MIRVMKTLGVVIVGCLVGVITANAQLFTLIDVSSSDFPLIRARIILSDESGRSIRDLQPADFEILENGIPRQVIQVTCQPVEERQPIQVVLVADKSMSMAAPTADGVTTRIELLKQAMNEFLDAVEFVGRTSVALTAFDAEAYLLSNFQGTPLPLKSALQALTPSQQVGTNYAAAFLDPAYGAIPLLESAPNPDNNRRAIIFFTDGQPIPPSSFNYDIVQEIITRAQFADIEIYPITLDLRMHPELRKIARETGGLAFEQLKTVEEVKAIYRLIADRLQGVEACEIIWQSDVGCGATSRIRQVDARYRPLNLQTNVVYVAPERSVAELEVSSYVVGFGNPLPGETVEREIALTARNADFSVHDVQFSGNGAGFAITDWGGNPPPFVIAQGETRTIRFAFTGQPQQRFEIQTLMITATPCPIEVITLWGGRPGQADAPVQLLSPDGGEIFASCDSIAIRWSGIPAYQPVSLWYSDDKGTTWNLIEEGVTGYRYIWVPPAPGQEYMIKVIADANVPVWQWVNHGATVQSEAILSVASNTYGWVVALGRFEGQPIEFRDTTVRVSSGRRFLLLGTGDGVLYDAKVVPPTAKAVVLNDQGYVFVLTDQRVLQFQIVDSLLQFRWNRPFINPLLRDTLQRIVLDPQGRCYILRTSLELLPGNQQLWRSFVEQISVNGIVTDRLQIPDVRASHCAVDIDGNVILAGFAYPDAAIQAGAFLAKFTGNGDVQWQHALENRLVTTDLVVDIAGNVYQGGFFSGMIQLPGRTVTSYGAADGLIVAYRTDGRLQWLQHFYSIGSMQDQIWALSVNRSGNIFAAGTFQGRVLYSNGTIVLRKQHNRSDQESFVVAIDEQGVAQWWRLNEGRRDDQLIALSADPQFGVFAGGWYTSSPLSCYPYQLDNAGQQDFLLGRIVPLPGGEDRSDSVFTIVAPQLRVAAQQLDFGIVPVGQQKILYDTICNEGTLPVEIVLSITQLNSQDFAVLVGSDTVTILPGECLPIKLLFQPLREGIRRTFLDITSDCFGTITVELRGEGGIPCDITVQGQTPMIEVVAGQDTVFEVPAGLCNNNSYELSGTVSIQGPGASFYTLLSSPNFQLLPGECYTATVRLQAPLQTGILPSAWLEYTVPADCDQPITRLIAAVLPIPPDIVVNASPQWSVPCPDSVVLMSVFVSNRGQEPLIITDYRLDVPGVASSLVTPLPRIVESMQWDTLQIAVWGSVRGDFPGIVRIESNDPDDSVWQQTVMVRIDQAALRVDPSTVNLGFLLRTQFPFVRQLMLYNTGTVPVTVEPVVDNHFSLQPVGGGSVVVLPGESIVLTLQIDSLSLGPVQITIPLSAAPLCETITLSVIGTVLRPAIVVQAPSVNVDPRQTNVRIPITIRPPESVTLDMVFTGTIAVDPAVFWIWKVEGNSVLDYTLELHQQQLVTFRSQIPSRADTLWLVGDAMLGDRLATPISVQIDPKDTLTFAFSVIDGQIQLINICTEGGTRLLVPPWKGAFGIVVQSITDRWAQLQVHGVERGNHRLVVYNLAGQIVWKDQLVVDKAPQVQQYTLPIGNWPAGVYTVVLYSPTQVDVQVIGVRR